MEGHHVAWELPGGDGSDKLHLYFAHSRLSLVDTVSYLNQCFWGGVDTTNLLFNSKDWVSEKLISPCHKPLAWASWNRIYVYFCVWVCWHALSEGRLGSLHPLLEGARDVKRRTTMSVQGGRGCRKAWSSGGGMVCKREGSVDVAPWSSRERVLREEHWTNRYVSEDGGRLSLHH